MARCHVGRRGTRLEFMDLQAHQGVYLFRSTENRTEICDFSDVTKIPNFSMNFSNYQSQHFF